MKDLVITGHTGFIGRSLVQKLQHSSFSITGISRTRLIKNKIKQKQRDILQLKNSDIKNNSTIIHLSALADFMFCQKHPTECFSTNVIGTEHLLDLARKKDCKLIYASTSHVYGIPQKLPLSENHCREASSIYSASKLNGEILCESFSKTYGMDITIARFFSVYGPSNPSYLVLPKIIKQLLTQHQLKLGNLFPKRDFIYIDDVISALVILLKNTHGFNTFNVGSGQSISIQTLCKKLMILSGKNIPISQEKNLLRKYDIPEIRSDISKIKKLGWHPKVSLDEGLKRTLEWHKHTL